MRKKPVFGFVFVAVCVVNLTLQSKADSEKEGLSSASHPLRPSTRAVSQLIGHPVLNEQEEILGQVYDIILETKTGNAPYAIIALDSSVSDTPNKVAVPLRALKCSAEGKPMILRATPAQLRNASKKQGKEWSEARDAEWCKKVDGFYGTPEPSAKRLTWSTASATNDTRKFVRDPAPKGGELLMTPSDTTLAERICDRLDLVHVHVQEGVTHLYGSVPNEQTRDELETQVRGVQGVHALESHLTVRNP